MKVKITYALTPKGHFKAGALVDGYVFESVDRFSVRTAKSQLIADIRRYLSLPDPETVTIGEEN